MFGTGSKQVLRVGDRVRAHFQNRSNEKSAGADVGTLLQFTTSEAEVHFDDGVVQQISKTWIAERISAWELDVAPGDLVVSHYASGKGRTLGTDMGVVLAVLGGGRVRLRFQDNVVQMVPIGWVEQVTRLQPGDRVMSSFKVNDGRGARSSKADMASVMTVSTEEVHLVFDDNIEQNVPKIWVSQRTREWDLRVDIGTAADVHFEVGDDGRRSTATDIGIVVTSPLDGRVTVQFQDTIRQSVPLGWIVSVRTWEVGDRVQAHFKTGNGDKSTDTDVATVLATNFLEAELYFDDGIQQCVSKAWVTERVKSFALEVPELAVGDVVVSHFKCPNNLCRSVQTDRGIILSMLPKGQVSVMFQDDVTQVIPKGWIETLATRWSGQRETLDEASGRRVVDLANPLKPRAARGNSNDLIKPNSSSDCVICMDARPNGVIVHGETCHQSTCFDCAKRLHINGDPCPICREAIETVCRIPGS